MLTSLRNYLITLLIAMLIFGPLAYFLTGLIIDCVGPSFGIADGSSPTQTMEPSVTTSISDIPSTPTSTNGTSFNMLIVGTDYQPSILKDYAPDAFVRYPMFENGSALTQGGSLSDYMLRRHINADMLMLLRVDKTKGRIIFCYLPPEMLINCGQVEMTLGETYEQCGIDYLMKKVMSLTGFSIDFYTIIDIAGVESFVDAIGGVTMNVPCAMTYADPAQNLNISLKAGVQKLDGKKATDLLRFNNYPASSGYSRQSVTLSFFSAAAEKLAGESILSHAATIYRTVVNHATTTFSANDLTEHLDVLRQYSSYETKILSYPGSSGTQNGRRVFVPNTDKAILSFADYR